MAKRKPAKVPTNTSKPPPVTGKRKRPEVQTKECVICVETKSTYRNFPAFTTCSHDPDTCLSCVAKQTVILLQASGGKGWSACRCPQCDVAVATGELQGALPRALVKEMKEMVDKAHQSTDDSWRWCLALGCGHGSLQAGRNEMIRCRKCDYKMCFKHQVPWHQGYTCQEYETSHPQAAITKTNEEMIRKMSKPCPGCGIAVEKIGGCNHMNCGKCGSTWLWDNPAAGHLTLAGPRAIGPPHRPDVPGVNAQLQAVAPPMGLNNPAVQPAPDPNPYPDRVVRRRAGRPEDLLQHIRLDTERSRAQRQAQPSAAPQSQSQAPVPGLIVRNEPFPPHFPFAFQTPFWTIEDRNFRWLPPPGGTAQTAIDLTREDNRPNVSEGRRSRR